MHPSSRSELSTLHRVVTGRAVVLGDDVDSFALVARRARRVPAPALLGRHLLRSVRPDLAGELRPGDVLVAGRNFGYRVYREHALMALLGAGVRCVVATSFARSFVRLGAAHGLTLLEAPDAVKAIADGDRLRVDLETGRIEDLTHAGTFRARPGAGTLSAEPRSTDAQAVNAVEGVA